MANNKFQIKRTTVSSRTPNTTNSGNSHFIDTGELALNLTDGKMFSSNGSVYFEIGSNLENIAITSNATFGSSGKIIANGTFGTDGQVLASNGTTMYWATGGGGGGSGTVTQVNTGVGLSGGPITTTGTISVVANDGIVANTTGLFANAGTGVVVNATGIHVNSSYIATISSNNASFLDGVQAASYVQNTDSRTLSGNLVISGTSFTPSSNTVQLGNSTQRWVLSANTGDFTGTVLCAAMNSPLITVGTDFTANTTGAYHIGLINAASFNTSGLVANTTGISPTSNTILLGNSIGRFVISANTIDTSGLITGGAGATITGQVNASTGFGSGTINATSNGFFANATTISVGNSSVNTAITHNEVTSTSVTSDQFRLIQNVLGNVSGATTIDLNNGSYVTATATGGVTWSVTNYSSTRAQGFILKLTNGGAGTQTWMNGTKFQNNTAPTLRASGVDILSFITDDNGSNWKGVLSIANCS